MVTKRGPYEAFGNIVASTGTSTNNKLANTKERDFSTGLDNHGFRYYDAELGLYISRDPIGYGDGMNVYRHVGHNPINHIDPEGLFLKKLWTATKDTAQGLGMMTAETAVSTARAVKHEVVNIPSSVKQTFSGVREMGVDGVVDTVGSSSAGVGDALTFGVTKKARMGYLEAATAEKGDHIVDKDAYETGHKSGKIARRAIISASTMGAGKVLTATKYGKQAVATYMVAKGGYSTGKGINQLGEENYEEGAQNILFGFADMAGGFGLVMKPKPPSPEGKPNQGTPKPCFLAGTLVLQQSGDVAIETLEVGDRVETTDATDDTTHVDDTWKKISLTMRDATLDEDRLDLVVLRSPEWIKRTGAEEGKIIHFILEEMGIEGSAVVSSIEPCPVISTGAGRVVLATVTHFNSDVYTVSLADGRVLEPTSRHRLYSVDRDDWIATQYLKTGEFLRTKNGRVAIKTVRRKNGQFRVYNIEVETDHCYYVGKTRVLSHNNNPCATQQPPPKKGTFGGKQDTSSSTDRAAFRNAKEQNGIPRSQQPDKTYTVKERGTGKDLKQYDFTNSKGKKVSIRRDNAKKYGRTDGKGDQTEHYNAGNSDEKLKQHHDVKKNEN